MHREFKELLSSAEGRSEFIIALFMDIRGFSRFSQTTESPDAAMFIKRVYRKLIEDYFPDAEFFKPTGDGLMVIFGFNEQNLEKVSNLAVESSIRCVKEFGEFCKDDPMINFPVPDSAGIGVARGTACRLVSGEKTLDFSGRLLNLAARLTGLARPSGVVIDSDFTKEMIPAGLRKRFREGKVYIRGIAEYVPRPVFILDLVTIPKENTEPLGEENWRKISRLKTLATLKALAPRFAIPLRDRPEPDSLTVVVRLPLYKGGSRVAGHFTVRRLSLNDDFSLHTDGNQHRVVLNVKRIAAGLASSGVLEDDKVRIVAKYTNR